jgi:Fe-S cluster assembly scaffold protein SufB
LLPEEGEQQIGMHVEIEEDAAASVLAHCTFPNAVNVRHAMEAEITVAAGARYEYFERHVHGPHGGVLVLPKARVHVLEGARFRTEFELLSGRVGRMEIDYEVDVAAHGALEMLARVFGREDDTVILHETGHLNGEYARAALQSHIALRGRARGEVFNTITADAPYARGHVDCKEIVQDEAVARAVPIVQVSNPRAHVTHEAAIGSVDSKQLQTLMSRGLSEDKAVDLIIEGLLS